MGESKAFISIIFCYMVLSLFKKDDKYQKETTEENTVPFLQDASALTK